MKLSHTLIETIGKNQIDLMGISSYDLNRLKF